MKITDLLKNVFESFFSLGIRMQVIIIFNINGRFQILRAGWDLLIVEEIKCFVNRAKISN